MQRFLTCTILAAVALLALPARAARAQADSSVAASVPPAAAMLAAPGTLAAVAAWADSAALADSVRLIAAMLTANGAPAARATPVARAIMTQARRHSLDPLLLVGIIGVENAVLSPGARSRAGARGVMQVMPFWKRHITDCGDDLRQVDVNVCFGARVLRIALDETSSVREALLRYNGCVRAPGCRSYPSLVFSWAGRALLLTRTGAEGRRLSLR